MAGISKLERVHRAINLLSTIHSYTVRLPNNRIKPWLHDVLNRTNMLIETFGSSIAFTKNNYSEYEQTEFDMQWYLYDKNTILAHQHLPCRIIIDSLLNSSPTKIVVRVENQTFFPGYFANNGLIRAIGYGAEILEI